MSKLVTAASKWIVFAGLAGCTHSAPPSAAHPESAPPSATPPQTSEPAPSTAAEPSASAPTPTASAPAPAPAPKAEPEPEPLDPAKLDAKGPARVYLAFLAGLDKAKTLDAVLPFYVKEVRAPNAKAPAKEKAATLEFMKKNTPKDVKVLRENIEGDKATVLVKGDSNGGAVKGKALLVREGGKWLFESHEWDEPSGAAEAGAGTPTVTKPTQVPEPAKP